jgi:hypothetical protein
MTKKEIMFVPRITTSPKNIPNTHNSIGGLFKGQQATTLLKKTKKNKKIIIIFLKTFLMFCSFGPTTQVDQTCTSY